MEHKDIASHGQGLHFNWNKIHQSKDGNQKRITWFPYNSRSTVCPHTLPFYENTLFLWIFSSTADCDISIIFIINYCTRFLVAQQKIIIYHFTRFFLYYSLYCVIYSNLHNKNCKHNMCSTCFQKPSIIFT